MGGVDDRGSLIAQLHDTFEDVVSALGIYRNCGLIEEDELRLVRDTAGYVEAPQESARKLAGHELLVVLKSDELDRVFNVLLSRGLVAHVEAAEIIYILTDRQLVEHRNLLENHTYLLFKLVVGGLHLSSEDTDLTLVILKKRKDAVDRGGLARAVGSEKSEDLSFPDGHIKMIESNELLVSFHEFADFYCVFHVKPPDVILGFSPILVCARVLNPGLFCRADRHTRALMIML